MRIIGIVLMLLSFAVNADDKEWLLITAAANTASGIATYIGEVDSDKIEQISVGKEPPTFIKIYNLTVVDQNGNMKKTSEFLWGGSTKYINGDVKYIRVNNIIDMQSITEEFIKELDSHSKPKSS